MLDAPFALIPAAHAGSALDLSAQQLCTAVCNWVLLTGVLALPAAILWVQEARERHRFYCSGGGAGPSAAGAAAANVESTYVTVLGFVYVAEIAWCLLRTAAILVS